MIWYIKNWNRFTADNKMSVLVGVLFFMYAGYLLWVLFFPQYLNIEFNKPLALFMLVAAVYGGHLMAKSFRNTQKMEKRKTELHEKHQTLVQLRVDLDQIRSDIIFNVKSRTNSKDTEKSNKKLEMLTKQFNEKQQEAMNLMEDCNQV